MYNIKLDRNKVVSYGPLIILSRKHIWQPEDYDIIQQVVTNTISYLIPLATSYGVVSHEVPLTTLPSGKVTEMGSLGYEATFSLYSACRLSNKSILSFM